MNTRLIKVTLFFINMGIIFTFMAVSTAFFSQNSNLELETNVLQLSSIPLFAILISISLIELRRVIRNIMDERVLIRDNAKRFKNISYILFAASIANIFIPTILSLFSLNLRIINIPINVEAILIFILGLLSLLISDVFNSIIKNKAENKEDLILNL